VLVTSLKHLSAVLKRFQSLWKPGRRWLVLDTETKPKPGFPSNDALVLHRADIQFFSLCYLGESYSCPTSIFAPQYPTIYQWVDLLRSIADDPFVTKVFHNANYDINQFKDVGIMDWPTIWDTMIGAWKAEAELENGLKSRIQNFGRVLRKTASIDFSNLEDVAVYAEEDVIATDELYQMQRYGYIARPRFIPSLTVTATGTVRNSKQNPLPSGKIVVEDEDLDAEERKELIYQEFPYLRATIRAERYGFPFDAKLLLEIRRKLSQDKDDLLKAIFKTAGGTVNLRSPKQMEALFDELGIQVTRKTKQGKSSFNAKSLMSLTGAHPLISKIQQYKKLAQLQSFYTGVPNPSPKKYKEKGLEHYVTAGRIYSSVKTIGAVTGRTSCLTGKVVVKTSRGGMPLLAIIKANEANLEVKAKTHKRRYRPVEAAYRNGKRQVYRVETEDGKQICATKDHLFLTPFGWRSLAELCPGDKVITASSSAHHRGIISESCDSVKQQAACKLGYRVLRVVCSEKGMIDFSKLETDLCKAGLKV
jgi:hypothetical protein